MKTEDEAQRVHDVLCPIINHEMPLEMDKESSLYLLGAHDALSWILNLADHERFDVIINDVLKSMHEAGYDFGERRNN